MRLDIVKNAKSLTIVFILLFSLHHQFILVNNVGATDHASSPDQSQDVDNYGYWFEKDVVRIQEFIPSHTVISRIDLGITKNGNPGNVLVSINSTEGRIWNTTIQEDSITSPWVNITLNSLLGVIPGNTYKLIVTGDTVSPDASNRYFWDGNSNSFYRGDTDVQNTNPYFDYRFVTWGNYDNAQSYIDQSQTTNNYGYWFEKDVVRWQEFVPTDPSLSQIDLLIDRNGNPGDVLVSINGTEGRIWNTTLPESTVPSGTNWNNITLDSPLGLEIGNPYKIIVTASKTSLDPSNRYFLSGYTSSDYPGMTDISNNDFDYTFVTRSHSQNFVMDQGLVSDNYGYWFEKDTIRWQSFTPTHSVIAKIDLRITKSGNPGDVLVSINGTEGRIWNTTIPGSSIPETTSWNSVSLDTYLPVIAGKSYTLIVRANQSSPDSANRYFWRGHTNSNYNNGITDVYSGAPSFDYSFAIYGKILDLDQTQAANNYGYWFEKDVVRYQEFIPSHTTISQIDLLISKSGSPGNVIVEIENSDGRSLWNKTILEADVISGWNTIPIHSLAQVIPGETYRLVVTGESVSPDSSNRYFWSGHTNSNYTHGMTDISNDAFDYTFKIWSAISGPSISSIVQNPADPYSFNEITISAVIKDPKEVQNPMVYYRGNGAWMSVMMEETSDNYYVANLGIVDGENIDYYITAMNSRNILSVDDNNGNYYSFSVVTDSVLPEVSSPDDITYTEGETGNVVTWTIGDMHPGILNFTIDGTLVQENSNWTNGTVTLPVDGLSVGTHSVVIYVYDIFSNLQSDSVTVEVLADDSDPGDGDDTDSSSSPSDDPAEDSPNFNLNGFTIVPLLVSFAIARVVYKRKLN